VTSRHVEAPPSSPTLRIAPMRRRHLRSVLRIEAEVYPKPWSLGLYLGELALPEERRIYLVARSGGHVVGHAGLMFAADDGHVTTVAVDPRWQRRGIAARLLVVLFRAAVARGASALTLEVRAGNEPAMALYRRFGFVEAGLRKGYYAETGDDAVIMWATDVASPTYGALLDRIDADLGDAARVAVDPSVVDVARHRGDAR
jgi:[ribosomal protein S18]-alanine N-acetyltransferase